MVGTKQRTVHKAKTRSEYILRESMLMGANSIKIEGAYKVSNLGVQITRVNRSYNPVGYASERQVL